MTSLNKALFSFEGRIARGAFWAWSLGVLATTGILTVINISMLPPKGGDPSFVLLSQAVITLFMCYSQLALGVKRLHDSGKSGWWLLVACIPYLGGLWALIELGCRPGTKGPNRFGAQPGDGAPIADGRVEPVLDAR